jgi:hypothetical protein
MPKYKFIYCNKCKRFHLSWSFDFGDKKKACGVCFTKNIKEFQVESFADMAQIERMYKINKIINK